MFVLGTVLSSSVSDTLQFKCFNLGFNSSVSKNKISQPVSRQWKNLSSETLYNIIWAMVASPSLLLFKSRPSGKISLDEKHVICRIQCRDNKAKCNGFAKCTAPAWFTSCVGRSMGQCQGVHAEDWTSSPALGIGHSCAWLTPKQALVPSLPSLCMLVSMW